MVSGSSAVTAATRATAAAQAQTLAGELPPAAGVAKKPSQRRQERKRETRCEQHGQEQVELPRRRPVRPSEESPWGWRGQPSPRRTPAVLPPPRTRSGSHLRGGGPQRGLRSAAAEPKATTPSTFLKPQLNAGPHPTVSKVPLSFAGLEFGGGRLSEATAFSLEAGELSSG